MRYGIAVLAIFAIIGMSGCDDFFVPTCQEQDNCTTTTITTTTGTGTDTGSDRAAAAGTGASAVRSDADIVAGDSSASSQVFVANAITGDIGIFRLSAGEIESAGGLTLTQSSPPVAVSATPDGKWLFAATSSGTILDFPVFSGELSAEGEQGQVAATVPHPVSMSIDPSGKLLFVVSSDPSTLYVFHVDSTGSSPSLLPVSTQSPIALDSGVPTQVLVAPEDRYLAVTLGVGGMDLFPLNVEDGALGGRTHILPLHSGAEDTSVTFDGSSRYLYAAESGAGIRAFSIAGRNGVTELSGSPFGAGFGTPSSVVADSANGALYAAYPGSGKIVAYGIASDGTLNAIATADYTPVGSATALSLDATGRFLLMVAGNTSSPLQAFAIDSVNPGKLVAMASGPSGAVH